MSAGKAAKPEVGDLCIRDAAERERRYVDFEYTEQRLPSIMKRIYRECYETAAEFTVRANIVGSRRLAEATAALGHF